MSAKTTTTSLSTRDVEFLDRLRELVSVRQSTMPATTKAPGRTADDQGMDATQREIRARWDFDGSILVGRVDTADGETYYIGTRAVATASEGTLVHVEEGDDTGPLAVVVQWGERVSRHPVSRGDIGHLPGHHALARPLEHHILHRHIHRQHLAAAHHRHARTHTNTAAQISRPGPHDGIPAIVRHRSRAE